MLIRSLLISFLVLVAPCAEAGSLWRMCRVPFVWMGLAKDITTPRVTRITAVDIGRKLGQGGYGTVYQGKATVLGENEPADVVIKDTTPRFADPKTLAAAEQAITAEANAYNKVHPDEVALVRIDGNLLMVQLVFPASAAKKDRPALDSSQFFSVHKDKAEDRAFRKKVTAAALDELDLVHAKGMNHNDIKPGNLLISEEGKVRLIDYGLARDTGSDLDPTNATLAYLSPRRFSGARKVETRDDVHAMGLTLLEAEMGKPLLDLKEYNFTRNFLRAPFLAWKRVPDADSRISPERAMAHFTSAKTTTKQYRELLAASDNPETFRAAFAKLWVKTYNAETSPDAKDQLIFELFLSPKLGPELVKAIPDAKIRNAILARGREMQGKVETSTDLLSWMGWAAEAKPAIDEFLRNY